jgi:hypothetical protein
MTGMDNQSFEDPGKAGECALLFVVGPTLATNLLSTGMIAWKAWYTLPVALDSRQLSLTISPHRQCCGPVREHLCGGSGSMRVDRVFTLLIESAFIYCCIWVCPTSRSVNYHRMAHWTITDFIWDLGFWCVS